MQGGVGKGGRKTRLYWTPTDCICYLRPWGLSDFSMSLRTFPTPKSAWATSSQVDWCHLGLLEWTTVYGKWNWWMNEKSCSKLGMCSFLSPREYCEPAYQFSSVTQSCLTLCNPMDCRPQASLSITNSRSLLKLMPIESVMPSNHLILCHPLLLLPSIFPSISVFSKESVLCIRVPKYWSFSFSISPSKSIQDWFPLGLIGWMSLQSKGFSKRVFSNTKVQKHQFFGLSFLYSPTLTSIHDYWKYHSFD